MNIRLCLRLDSRQSTPWITRDVDLPAVPREGEVIRLPGLHLYRTVGAIYWDVDAALVHVRMSNLNGAPIDTARACDVGWVAVDDPAHPEQNIPAPIV